MPNLVSIQGNRGDTLGHWATTLDGTVATAATTGLATVSSGANQWIHRLFAQQSLQPPAGSAAVGYLESGIQKAPTFRLETTQRCNGNSGDSRDYQIGFWLMAHPTGAVPQATGAADYLTFANGVITYVQLAIAAANAVTMNLWQATGALKGTQENLAGVGANQNQAGCLPFDTWVWIVFHWRNSSAADTADGAQRIYINGRLVSSLPINGEVTGSANGADFPHSTFQFGLPAYANIQWRICPALEAWNGTDFPIRPLHALDTTSPLGSEVQKTFLTFHPNGAAPGQGIDFLWTANGATVAYTDYGGSGTSPSRGRVVLTGTGTTPSSKSIDKLTTASGLVFNERGWVHLCWGDLWVPSGCTLSLSARDFGDTGDTLLFSIASSVLTGPTAKTLAWNHSNRYALLVHLHTAGRAAMTLIDLTADIATTTLVQSVALSNWTPAALGPLAYTTSITGASPIEIGFFALCTWPTISGIDSNTLTMWNAGVGGPTPGIICCDDLGRGFPFGTDNTMIPGGYYPQREKGFPRRLTIACLGRTLITRALYSTRVVPGLAHTAGVRFLQLDGCSLSDIYGTNSNGADVPSVLGNQDPHERAYATASYFQYLLDTVLPNDNKVQAGTMLRRTRKFTVTAASNASPIVLTLSAPHGLPTGTQRISVQNVLGNTAANVIHASAATTSGGSTISLTGVAGNDNYTSGGTVTGFTANESASDWTAGQASFVDLYATRLRDLLARAQVNGLVSLSDILADELANPANYPASASFWLDLQHVDAVVPASGTGPSYFVATRMLQLETIVASSMPPQAALALQSRILSGVPA